MILIRLLPVVVFSLQLMVLATPGPRGSSAQNCAASANPELCSVIEHGEYRNEIKNFYAAGNYSLAWSNTGRPTPQAIALIQIFQNADQQGLRKEDYGAGNWGDRVAHLSQTTLEPMADLARFDLDLTASVMRYMSDLACGRIDPRRLNLGLNVNIRKRCNFSEFLRARVINAADVVSVLKQIEPPYGGYQRTKAALVQYLDLANEGEGEALLRPRKTLQPGDTYSGLPAMEKRLRRLGDLPAADSIPVQSVQSVQTSAPSNTYAGAIVQAVKHFQQRHGLTPDGKIDSATYKQLTMPLSYRIKQLQLTLERWRWMPPDLPSRLIVVNIPEFVLRAYDNHHAALSMKVIVGKAFRGRETPVFQDEMEYLIFRPYWNVPGKIVRKELIPDIQKKPEFMARHQYRLVNDHGEVVAPEMVNAQALQELRAGKLGIRQEPGPENSLGLIKFVFPNHYDVYLHGTPEQKLFSRSRRDFSHGCIRVEDPAALAQWVLHDDPAWTRERIESAMEATKSLRVDLPKPLPVLIVYGTAFVEENGEVRFFEDIYGQDLKLERALDSAQRTL